MPSLRKSCRGIFAVSNRAWGIFSLVAISFAACTEAPLTKRRQIIFTNEEQELGVGEQQYQQLLDAIMLNYDAEANRIVSTIGQRLAHAVGKANYVWEFVVIDDPQTIDAWVLPGGKIGVCTGLFPVARDENGLAILLAHEVAHAIARHQGEKNTRDALMEIGGLAVTFGPDIVRQGYNLGTNLGLILPFGLEQEAEADYIGLILAAKAGYDPSAAAEVWDRVVLAGEQQAKPVALLTTHPNYEARRQNLARWLPEALLLYKQAEEVQPVPLPALESLERPLVIEEQEKSGPIEPTSPTAEHSTEADSNAP